MLSALSCGVLRQAARAPSASVALRHMTGAPATVSVAGRDGVAVLSLANGRVNALNAEFMEAIVASLRAVEADAQYSSIVVTSALPGVFSAGLVRGARMA